MAGTLRVAGAIASCDHGVNLGPLLAADNLIGASLMRKYLTNGEGIELFPAVTLSPSGSVVFWLSVKTDSAVPGKYRSTLSYDHGPKVEIVVQVLDVTLPDPLVWIRGWSYTTALHKRPFIYGDRVEREVAYRQGIGINVWLGTPSLDHPGMLARKTGRVMFQLNALGNLEHIAMSKPMTADQVSEGQKKYLREYFRKNVDNTKKLGLDYDEWFLELWDEPGYGATTSYHTFAKLLKQIDPNVRIYANPCFWVGWQRDGVHDDDVVADLLAGWYNQTVDISVPLFLLVDNPMSRSYEIFNRPGPRGPIATRQSESVREGWEDYRLLTLLKERGLTEQLSVILRAYANGEPFEELRLRALEAAASQI